MNILSELEGKEYTEGIYKDYDIRFCREDEYDDLKEFLRKYWKENHIFVLSKEVFDFQHLDKQNHRYNYVIARSNNDNDIHALLGFVLTSQFDYQIKRTMIWPCIWKNRDDINRKGLGVSMYHYLKNNIDIETISILGISEIALSIYKQWNFTTGKIKQYVMPNFQTEEHLASGLKDVYASFTTKSEDSLELIEITREEYEIIPEDAELFEEYADYKTKAYYINRFIKHPVYRYHFLAIKDGEQTKAIMITRVCGDGIRNCLRIVDYIGQIKYISAVKNQLQKYLIDEHYEYVDFVEVGLKDEELIAAGFINRKTYCGVVVPNYFEPFLKENIELDYAFKTISNDVKKVFFKADADQDRPNILI